MNLKTMIPLGLAVVLGIAAMMIARNVLTKNNTPAEKQETVQIVILTKDLAAGSQITAADLGARKITGDVSIPGAITNPNEVEGRVLVAQGVKDSPVLATMLAPKGTVSGLQAVIPDGMRAITIEINEFSGVAGNLVAGCRVDLMTTLTGENGEMTTRTVVQNVKVQSLGIRRPPEGDQPSPGAIRSVTLVATPKEAEAIELAAVAGRAHLLLRSSSDQDRAHTDGVTLSDLRGNRAQANNAVAKSDPFAPTKENTLTHVSTGSTTQPTELTNNVFNNTRRRPVQVIRGSSESQVLIEDAPFIKPAAPAQQWMTNASDSVSSVSTVDAPAAEISEPLEAAETATVAETAVVTETAAAVATETATAVANEAVADADTDEVEAADTDSAAAEADAAATDATADAADDLVFENK